MKQIVFLIFVTLFLSKIEARICYSTGNGFWNNTGTWSCSGGPTCGDTIIVQAGHTVTVSAQNDYYSSCPTSTASAMLMIVNGTLKFDAGNKINFPCGSQVFVTSTGQILKGTGSGNSNLIEICNDIYWKAGDGNVTNPVCWPPGCSSLPVEFIAFTGELEVKVVYLKWKTNREINNNYFVIEKSHDGKTFSPIAQIKSKGLNGNSSSPLDYEYIDQNLKHPLYYYRLKQFDLDGSYQYSKTISVRIYAPEFKVYPNPNNGIFSIDVPTLETNQHIDLRIITPLGQTIHEERYTVINDNITGARVEVIPDKPFSKGTYIAILNFNGETFRLKLVIN